jgi:DNA mismatch repair protein PMS2
MATIKAIEAQSVHQIQSGQVIVDLCSVVKELVENGLDAGANSIEVRFKNNGLDSIEVQDNGSGISPVNYESVALKHYTSKLSVYDDLSSLQTFGFRGEALSSLCALSNFYMTTAQADEAPKGNRLEFEISGRLKSASIVACQKGTIATVENLFESLPVRRKELAKNIKREYGKVVGLLHAYACVCTGVRFAFKNAMPKGKGMTVFATKINATTRDNIANVYGAKTLQALVTLDLELDFQPTLTQISRKDAHTTRIKVSGHISRPVWGEGRQTPDRQMFFVNGRPCGLPQVAKAMNEVYKSFNVSQSPFIFADFQMDTNAYDVNVSPDKRSILLHNATDLIEKLKETLNALFERQDQTIPQSHIAAAKLPAFKQLSIKSRESVESIPSDTPSGRGRTISNGSKMGDLSDDDEEEEEEEEGKETDEGVTTRDMLHDHFRAQASTREEPSTKTKSTQSKGQKGKERRMEKLAKAVAAHETAESGVNEYDDLREIQDVVGKPDGNSNDSGGDEPPAKAAENIRVRDFNQRMAEQQRSNEVAPESPSDGSTEVGSIYKRDHSVDQGEQHDHPNVVQNAFDRMRPQRAEAEVATITIGDHTSTTIVGSGLPSQRDSRLQEQPTKKAKKQKAKSASMLQFSQSLRKFGAPGTQVEEDGSTSEGQSPHGDENVHSANQEDDTPALAGEEASRSPEASRADAEESDPDYVDQAEEKAEEKARVAKLIRLAEESAAKPSKESLRRANKALKSSTHKDATTTLLAYLALSLDEVEADVMLLHQAISGSTDSKTKTEGGLDSAEISDEEKLSLTISKNDFADMDIIGQFNLGFILALRKASDSPQESSTNVTRTQRDELFIIDQHASDEKYNFERLQGSTVVSNQRLVHPIVLELTAVEEEVVLENLPALEKNGFVVQIDTSGDSPVGQRCKLLTLPLSKEVTFDTRDLDELIHLVSESPALNNSEGSAVPRPGKVRKMFAMRACRSSIMIGKTLSQRQMAEVLRHMGEIEKPWNCPHGRPTMRHLTGLEGFGGWREGAGLADEDKDGRDGGEDEDEKWVWERYARA